MPLGALFISQVTRAAGGTVGSGDCQASVSQTSTVTATSVNGTCIYTFTSGVNSFSPPTGAKKINFLVVGGGGGGGSNRGGGGGAGGFYESSWTYTSGSVDVVVGGGGAGGATPTSNIGVQGTDGGTSSITGGGASVAAGGGGGGGAHGVGTSTQVGRNGVALANGYTGPSGSGGGASMNHSNAGFAGGTATAGSGYANAGAASPNDLEPNRNTGGGGGAGGAGVSGSGGACDASTGVTPAGGAGRSSSIGGSSVTYAAGGGGGDARGATEACAGPDTPRLTSGRGLGGSGIGGNGAALGGAPTSASANTGSGGGAGNSDSSVGGDGGSGVVILSVDATKPVSSGTTTTDYLPKATNTVSVAYSATDTAALSSVSVFYSVASDLSSPTQCGSATALSGTSASGNITCTLPSAPTTTKTYYLYTVATDSSGLVEDIPGSSDDSFIHDAITPLSTANIVRVASNTAVIPVEFTATDSVGLDNVKAYVTINSNLLGGTLCGTTSVTGTSASGTVSCTVASPSNGTTYYFYTVATDLAGQVEASADYAPGDSAKYDTTRPQIVFGDGAGVRVKSSGKVNFTSAENGTFYFVSSSVTVTDEASITSLADNQFNSATATSYVSTDIYVAGLPEGNYNLYVADQASNLSDVYSYVIVIDNTAPTKPTGVGVYWFDDSGTSSSDGVTKITAPYVVANTSEGNGQVTFTAVKGASTATCTDSVSASGSTGTTMCKFGTLAAGTWTITAVHTDAAGNVSPTSDSYTMVIDTTAPSRPGDADLIDSNDYGNSSTDNITSASYASYKATPPSGESNGMIELKMKSGTTYVSTCTYYDTDTLKQCVLEPNANDGTFQVEAWYYDQAGNSTSSTLAIGFTYDRTAPVLTTTMSGTIGLTQTVTGSSNSTGRLWLADGYATTSTWPDISGLPDNQQNYSSYPTANANVTVAATGLAESWYYMYATDVAGNVSARSTNYVLVDATSPTVTQVSATSGRYKAGTNVDISVSFSENVVVTATPQILMSTGAGIYANYLSGSGTNTLIFRYAVGSSVNSSDLDYASTTALASGTIKDAYANSAVLTLPATGSANSLAGTSDVIIDTTAPTASFTNPSSAYSNATSVTYTFTFSEQVSAPTAANFSNTGTSTGCSYSISTSNNLSYTVVISGCTDGTIIPRLVANAVNDLAGNAGPGSAVTAGTTNFDHVAPTITACTCAKASGTAGTFTSVTLNSNGTVYLVKSTVTVNSLSDITSAADNEWNSNSVVASTSMGVYATGLVEGTYKLYATDLAGNFSAMYAGGSLIVDNVAPTFTVVGGNYGNGDVVSTTSSETGTVWFILQGTSLPSPVTADFLQNSGTLSGKRLVATITTANTPTNSQSFTNQGGQQTGTYDAYAVDAAGNVASVLTSAFTLDLTRPTLVSVVASSPNGTYLYGQTINIDVTFSEPMKANSSVVMILETGSSDRSAAYSSGTGTNVLRFTYTVQAGDTSSDLDVTTGGGIFSNSNLFDMYGNSSSQIAGNYAFPVGPSTAGSISYASDIVVDGVVPVVSSNVNSANGNQSSYYTTVTFSGDVTDFDLSDITRGGSATGCTTGLSTTSASVYVISYTGCSDGTISSSIRVDAVTFASGNRGPKSANLSATLTKDTAAPIVTQSPAATYFTATVAMSYSVNETSTVYLVNTNVSVTNVASITSAASNQWKSASYVSGTSSINGANLADGTYKFYAVDPYGNLSNASTATYTLDTVAPTASMNTGMVIIGGSATVRSNETGTVYLVKSTVTVTTISSILSSGSTNYKSQAVSSANTDQNVAVSGLVDGTYYAYASDGAGNLSAVSTNSISVDNTAPTVTNVTANSSAGNYIIGQTVLIDVLFNDIVNVDTTNGTPTLLLETGTTDRNATYVSGSGTNTLRFSYTVQAGDTTADLNYQSTTALANGGGTIKDNNENNATLTLPLTAGASSLASRSAIFVKGTRISVVGSSVPTSPTTSSTLSFGLSFSEAAYGLTTSDFTFGGTATGCTVSSVGTPTSSASITVTGCSDGTVILKLPALSMLDFYNNAGPAAEYSTTSITVDRTGPVPTFTIPTTPTTATSLAYTVTFNELMNSLAATDFQVTGTATGCSVAISAAAGTTVTVTLTSCSAGTVILSLKAGMVNDSLSNTGPATLTSAATVTRDLTAPTVSSFAPDVTPTNAAAPTFALTFSEEITGLSASDFTVAGTATACTVVPGSATGTVISISVTGCSGGTVILTLKSAMVADIAGNSGPASAANSSTLTIDRIAPSAAASPVLASSSDVGVSASDSKTNLTTVTISATTPEANGSIVFTATLNGTSLTCSSTVTSSNGSCVISGLTEGSWAVTAVFTDAAGNAGPTSSITTLVIDTTAPTVSITAPSSPIRSLPATFTVTFSESISGLAASDFTNNGGSSTGCTFTPASSSGTTINVSIDMCSDGTFALQLAANTVTDVSGNAGPAANEVTSLLTIDNGPPVATVTAATLQNTQNATVRANKVGTVYLVKSTVSVAAEADITSAANNAWNSVSISTIDTDTSLALTALSDGTYKAYAVDGQSRVSVASTASVVVDTTSPTAPVSIAVDSSSDTGSSSSDGLTKDNTPTIRVVASENGGTITVTATRAFQTDVVCTVAGSTTGSTCDLGTLVDGTWTLTAVHTDAALNVSSSVTGSASIDTVAPTVSGVSTNTVNGSKKSGVAIDIRVAFDGTVGVNTSSGSPTVMMETGSTDRAASFTSGSNSSVLVFTYTVQSGDTSSDLDYVATNSLALNGAVIADDAGNNATLTLASPGAVGSLANSASIVIDTTAPLAPTSVAIATASDSGSSSSDGITNDNTPTIRVVAAENGATVTVTASKTGQADVVCTVPGSTTGSTCDLATLADGVWTLTAVQSDSATNMSSSVTSSVTIDTAAPVVSGVSSNTTNGAKKAGATIDVRVTFDTAVGVDMTSGSPTLLMETGSTDRAASFTSGSNSSVLVFTYTVQSGDTSTDLDYVATNSLALNGAAITDVAGNNALLTLASPGSAGSLGANKALVIDTTAPSAPVSVAVEASSDSGTSSSDALTKDNTPTISVIAAENGGTVTVTASKSGETDVVCTMSGSTTGSTCDLATLVDGTWSISAVQTDTAMNVSSSTSGSTVIDTVAPTVSGVSSNTANGAKKAGASIDVRVSFDSSVGVDTTSGSPTLLMETGTTDRVASFTSGSNSTVLVFTYTVQSGDTSIDLDYVATNSLAMNGAAVSDAAGNNAVLTLASPGAAGSLAANKALVIDTTSPNAPTSVAVDSSSDTGSSSSDGLTKDNTPTIRVVAAENGGTVTVTASKSGETDVVCTMSGSTTGSTCDLATLVDGTWSLSAVQTDTATNSSSAVSGTLTIDTAAPTVSGVSSNTVNGAKKAGASIDARVTFDSAVGVDTTSGSPTILMETGTTDRAASFTSGSNSSVLVFTYTVQSGDTSSDLDYVATNSLALNGAAVSDAAGNNAVLTLASPGAAGSLGANKSIVIDTTAPSAPTSVVLATSSDTGSSSSDGLTKDNTPTISVVAAENGGTVTVTASKSGETDVLCTMSGSTTGATCDLATLVDGTWSLSAVQSDSATNSSSSVSGSLTIDTAAPVVSGVTSNTTNGAKKAAASIDVRVSFDSSVGVDTTSGSPTLLMETGTTDRAASFTSGSNSSVLVFTYTVQSGDTSSDLDYVATNSLALNGAVIADAAGNNAVLTLASPGAAGSLGANKSIVIDTAAPSAPISVLLATSSDSGSSSSDGLTNDNTPTISVVAAENGGTVTVTASRALQSDVTCTMSGSASSSTCDLATLVDGSWAMTAVQTDAAGNVSSSVSGSFVIDTVAPSATSVSSNTTNGAKKAGTAIDVRVTFDGAVGVNTTSGSPTLLMETGSTDRAASFTSGSNSSVLVFTYTVQSGDTSSDLDYVATNSLALNGAVVADNAGNSAVLTIPSPGASGSLAANKAIVIDTSAPNAPVLATATLTTTGNAVVRSAETGTVYLVKTSVNVGSLADITSGNGALWNQVSISSANTDTNLAATGLADGDYRAYAVDAAENVSASSIGVVTIDTSVPTITIAASPTSVSSGGTSSLTFTLSESLTGFDATDVSAGLGTIGSFSGSGTQYTATFTASAVAGGTAKITVAANAIVDAAGNSSAESTANITVASPTGTNGRQAAVDNNTNYIIEQFTTAGTYTFHVPKNVTSLEYIVIGGGGGGGGGGYVAGANGGGGGGGGAGSLRMGTLNVLPDTNVGVRVGPGGAGGVGGRPNSLGLERGAGGSDGTQSGLGTARANGGYGGCASALNASVSSCGYLLLTDGYGGFGGSNAEANGGNRASILGGGGGGGAGSFGVGGDTSTSAGGIGGGGTPATFYGISDTFGTGGNGGPGAAGALAGTAGAKRGNGGNGGGGGLNGSNGGAGGNGSDGFVAVRYALPTVTQPDLTDASDTGDSSTDNLTKLTTPTFTGTAPVGATVQLYVDSVASGSTCTASSDTGDFSCTTGVLSHGSHSITAKSSILLAGGVAESTSTALTINVDTVNPVATLTSATLQWGYNGSGQSNEVGVVYLVKTTETVTDEASILALADNVWNYANIGYVNTNATISTLGLTSGTYKLYALDAAGNLGLASSSSITYFDDTTAPTPSLTTGKYRSVDSATISSTEMGTMYLVKSTITVNSVSDITNALSTARKSASVNAANVTQSLSLSGLSEGTYYLYAIDGAGNLSSASTSSIVIDNTSPTVSSFTSVSSSYVVRTFDLTLTMSESVTGLSSSDFSNTGTASSCTFTPDASSGTTFTVTATCTSDGTVVARLSSNAVTDLAGNTGPASQASAASVTLGATPSKLVMTTNSSGTASGAAFTTQPVVSLANAQDLIVTSYAATVTASITQVNGTGSLEGIITAAVDTSTGRATFSDLGITGTAGTAYTITYSSGSLTVATQTVTVSVGAAKKLEVTTQPVGGASGAAFSTQPVVRIVDSGSNPVIAATASVSVTTSTGTIGGTRPKVTVSGVATFTDLTFSGLASQNHVLTFSATGLTSATSSTFNVTAGAPTQLVLTTQSVGTESGAAFTTQPVLEVRDSGGNKVTASSALVTANVSSGAVLEGTTSATASLGVATYSNLGISGTAGTSYTITYSSTGLSSAVQAVTPTVGPATKLQVSTQPVGAGAGAALATQPIVQVVDSGGNVIVGSNASIAVTASGGTLGGTTTKAASSGVATFTNLTFAGTAGTNYRLEFTSFGLTSATSSDFTVSVGAPTHLSITTQPIGAGAGALLATQPVVNVLDAGDNVVTASSASIAVTASGGTLGGTTTVSASNGVATYSTLTFAGTISTNYALTFSSSGLGTVQSNNFTVTVGADYQLAINTSAAGAKYKAAFTMQPVVEVQDAGGNRTGSSSTITATISSGTVLSNSGTTKTASASNGHATFSGLGIIGTPGSYTVTYSSGSLQTASQSITLNKADQSINTASVADRVFSTTAFAMSSSPDSGLIVSYVSTTTAVCTVSNADVTMVGIGTCSITASQSGNVNYNAATNEIVTFVISRATPTVTFGSLTNKTYGDSSFTVQVDADIPVAVSFAGTSGVCSVGSTTLSGNRSSATVSIIGAGSCSVTASRAQDATYFAATAASGSALTRTFSIAKAAGSIAYDPTTLTQTYNSNGRVVTAAVNSGTVTITYTGIAPTVYAPSTNPPVNAGSYAVVAVQNAANYDATAAEILTVNKAQGAVVIDANSLAQTYSGTSRSVLVSSTTPSGLATKLTYSGVNGTTYVPSQYAPTDAGTYNVNAVLDDMNYEAIATGTLTVGLGVQSTVTLINRSSTTFGTSITLSAVGGTGTGSLTYGTTSGPCTVDSQSGLMTPTGAGACVVTATRGASGNFGATSSSPFTVTINQAPQTVEFTSVVPTRPLPGNTYTPTATASSGLTPTIAITSGSGTVCTLSGGAVTIVASGTCEVTASQQGDANWLAASPVVQTMVAGRLNQSITFASIPTKTFGDPVFSLGATASSGRIVEYAVLSGSTSCAVDTGGVVTLAAIGSCVIEASQPGDTVYSPAATIRRTIIVEPTTPSAPFLASVSASDGSVTVAYNAPSSDGGLPVQAYSVEVRFAGSDRSFDVTKTDCTASLTCYIDGLTNGRTYNVSVAAVNAIGVGARSASSPLILPILNPQAVRGLTARAGNQIINVEWSAPSNLGGGTFVRYEVSIRNRSGSYQSPISISNYNTTSYQFTGLDNGTSYDVKIVTITSSGATEFTGNTAEVFEMPRTVASVPRDLTIAAPTGRVARVSWRIPQSDGGSAITSYVVNAQGYVCVFAAPSDVVCEISGLTPGSPLTIDVRAVNGVGQSQAATVSMNLPNRPTAPIMRSVVVNASTALASWLPPTSDGGQPLLGYLVYISETGSRVSTAQLSANDPQCSTLETSCQIEGLDPTKTYAFVVRAINAVGQSDASAPLDPFVKPKTASAPTKTPTAVKKPTVLPAGVATVTLGVNVNMVPTSQMIKIQGTNLKAGSTTSVKLVVDIGSQRVQKELATRTVGSTGTLSLYAMLNNSLPTGSYKIFVVAIGANGRTVSAEASFLIPQTWNSIAGSLPLLPPASQSSTNKPTTTVPKSTVITIPSTPVSGAGQTTTTISPSAESVPTTQAPTSSSVVTTTSTPAGPGTTVVTTETKNTGGPTITLQLVVVVFTSGFAFAILLILLALLRRRRRDNVSK